MRRRKTRRLGYNYVHSGSIASAQEFLSSIPSPGAEGRTVEVLVRLSEM